MLHSDSYQESWGKFSPFSHCETVMDTSDWVFIITPISFIQGTSNRKGRNELCENIQGIGFGNGGKQLFFITHGLHPQERMWGCISAPPRVIRDE